MSNKKITLQQYITCQNYRKEVDSVNRNKLKSAYSLQKIVDPSEKNSLANKIKQIKIFARSIIQQDNLFARLEKMLSQLQTLLQKKIQEDQQNFRTVHGILSMIQGDRQSSPIQLIPQPQKSSQDHGMRKSISIEQKSTFISSSTEKKGKLQRMKNSKSQTKSNKIINNLESLDKNGKIFQDTNKPQQKSKLNTQAKPLGFIQSMMNMAKKRNQNSETNNLKQQVEQTTVNIMKLARRNPPSILWEPQNQHQEQKESSIEKKMKNQKMVKFKKND